LLAYKGEELVKLRFEDITKDWLIDFDNFMARTAPSRNSRNIHLRNIRTVFNDAIDNEITSFYPFRTFTIRPEATPKRNLKVDELRTLFTYPAEEHALYYIDIFKLIFMLIGINVVDLCRLKELVDGRADFKRAKTHRLYSIKVEPEAMEIIERHHGKDWLIDVMDHYKDHNDFTRRMDRTLQKIGPVKRVGLGGKKIYSPLFPQLTTYWARHTWATIAAVELDIPKDIIAHALGHGNNTVTDIYIDFDQSKVDVANRRVLDYVLYGKR
jgi:integrase